MLSARSADFCANGRSSLEQDLAVVWIERLDELVLEAAANAPEHLPLGGVFELEPIRFAEARQKLEEHDGLGAAQSHDGVFCAL
jgi:hypothetical protein